MIAEASTLKKEKEGHKFEFMTFFFSAKKHNTQVVLSEEGTKSSTFNC
jgi:hypothetical protein